MEVFFLKTAEKLDWLEFTVMYCRNPGQVRTMQDELDEYGIKKHKFGDRLISAFFGYEGIPEADRNRLIAKFGKWVTPDEWRKYFNFNVWKILPYSLRGYAFIVQIGEDDACIQVRVPMRDVTEEDAQYNYFVVENVRRGSLQTFNAYTGLRIVFTGSNIPIERKKLRGDKVNGTVFPVRFHVETWNMRLTEDGQLFKIGRVDCALDVGYDFNILANMWQSCPQMFKVPYFRQNRRIDYNSFTGAGEICCGRRGAANDSYLRIYNKAAEQGDKTDFYPWDNFFDDFAVPGCLNAKKGFREVPWSRFELELRGQVACHFLFDYFDSVMDDDSPAHFIFDYIGIYAIERDQDLIYAESGRYTLLSPSPLWSEVINSYNLYCREGNENFVQFREELDDKNFKVSASATRHLYRGTPYRTGLRLLKSVDRTLHTFEAHRASPDALKKVSDLLCSAEDLVKVISVIPTEFADAAVRQRLEDISRMCCISQQRASDVLNEAGMKNYFGAIISRNRSTAELSSDSEDDSDDFIYRSDFDDFVYKSDFGDVSKNE